MREHKALVACFGMSTQQACSPVLQAAVTTRRAEFRQPCPPLYIPSSPFVSLSRRALKRQVMQRENQRISMRIDLEVLNSVDHIMTTSTRDSECVSVSV